MIFRGAGTALVTPYKNNKVDYEKYGELIDWQIEKGIDAIITCGTTGEGSTLTDAEHKEVIKYCVDKVNGRVPVVAGTGSNDTEYSLQLSQYAESVGADALMMVTPYYNKTTQRGLVNHYRYIAERVDIPIIVYHVPPRTGLKIEADTVVELSRIKNIVAMKDASGDISYLAKVMHKLTGTDFALYSGNDDMVVPLLSLGGQGVISVASNVIPSEMHDMVMNFFEGNKEESRRIQLEIYDFIESLFIETNPIPLKTCMNLMGFDVGELRMPLYEMSEANKDILIQSMNKLGLYKR